MVTHSLGQAVPYLMGSPLLKLWCRYISYSKFDQGKLRTSHSWSARRWTATRKAKHCLIQLNALTKARSAPDIIIYIMPTYANQWRDGFLTIHAQYKYPRIAQRNYPHNPSKDALRNPRTINQPTEINGKPIPNYCNGTQRHYPHPTDTETLTT